MRRKRFCKNILHPRHSEGVTALEFALIAPVFLMMLFGTLEYCLVMYATHILESATTNTSRLGKTGFSETGEGREETILAEIERRAAGMLDIEELEISTLSYEGFDNIGQAEPYFDANSNGSYDAGETFDDINGNGTRDEDMGAQNLGDAKDVVVYTVTYPWQVISPMLVPVLGQGGVVTLSARTVVRNEPYDDGAAVAQ
jgi:hypothetical protein